MNAVAETMERQETHADTRSMANALRMLAVDAVQQANSGHPGMPMGMAEIAVALWGRHLKHNPRNPDWAGSRPVRVVERTWVDAALWLAASDGLRPADR